MILRHTTARHARSIISSSAQSCKRAYASEISSSDRAFQPSTQDHKPVRTIPGHPSDSSSLLDSSTLPPTAATRELASSVAELVKGVQSLEHEVNAHRAATENAAVPAQKSSTTPVSPPKSTTPYPDLKSFYKARRETKKQSMGGSRLTNVYTPWELIKNPPHPDDVTLSTLLANQTHLGHSTSLWNPANSNYIFGIREGIHIISLDTTLSYLRRATKVVREIARRGGIILFVGTRKGHQEIIVNTARLAEGYHVFDRWVPGSLTNGQQILGECGIKVLNSADQSLPKYVELLSQANHPVLRPDLVVCLNPLENVVCLHECGLYSVPTIGVIDTDANPAWVTYPIPANDDSLRSIALIAGALGRAGQEGQQLRKDAIKAGERPSYAAVKVQRYLEGLQEIAEMDVDSAAGSKDRDK